MMMMMMMVMMMMMMTDGGGGDGDGDDDVGDDDDDGGGGGGDGGGAVLSKTNDTVNLTKNNTDVAGNGKEHQVKIIFFGILWQQCRKFVMVWKSESLRDRLHSALAEVWSEGTQCDQTTGNNDLATALRTFTNDTNEPGRMVFQGSTFCTKKRLTVWHTMPRRNEREQQRSPPKNAHGRNSHQIGLLQWLLNWRCHAHRHFREFSEN